METVLMLETDVDTLRLLLASDKHSLHFVLSKAAKLPVTRRNKAVDIKSLVATGA